MGILNTLNSIKIFRNAAAVATTFARDIDGRTLLAVLGKIVALEQGGGAGLDKLQKLVDWFNTAFPQYSAQVSLVYSVAKVVVELLNAVGLFEKKGKT